MKVPFVRGTVFCTDEGINPSTMPHTPHLFCCPWCLFLLDFRTSRGYTNVEFPTQHFPVDSFLIAVLF